MAETLVVRTLQRARSSKDPEEHDLCLGFMRNSPVLQTALAQHDTDANLCRKVVDAVVRYVVGELHSRGRLAQEKQVRLSTQGCNGDGMHAASIARRESPLHRCGLIAPPVRRSSRSRCWA